MSFLVILICSTIAILQGGTVAFSIQKDTCNCCDIITLLEQQSPYQDISEVSLDGIDFEDYTFTRNEKVSSGNCKNLVTKLDEAIEAMISKNNNNTKLINENNELLAEITKLLTGNMRLTTSEYEKLTAENKILLEENMNLRNKNKKLEEENINFNTNYVERETEITNLLGENKDLLQENRELQSQISDIGIEEQKPCRSSKLLQEICREGWIKNPEMEYCYYIGKQDQMMNFLDAKTFCQDLEGALVSVHSQQENDFIKSQISGRFWIGLSDSRKEGTFEWIEGDKAIYTDFHQNEPNNKEGNEDCVEYWRLSRGLHWNDVPCNTLKPPICKRPSFSVLK